VQCSAVQCSAVQCSAVQCSAVQCSASGVCQKVCRFCSADQEHSGSLCILCTVQTVRCTTHHCSALLTTAWEGSKWNNTGRLIKLIFLLGCRGKVLMKERLAPRMIDHKLFHLLANTGFYFTTIQMIHLIMGNQYRHFISLTCVHTAP
jgi:hypothetical protein